MPRVAGFRSSKMLRPCVCRPLIDEKAVAGDLDGCLALGGASRCADQSGPEHLQDRSSVHPVPFHARRTRRTGMASAPPAAFPVSLTRHASQGARPSGIDGAVCSTAGAMRMRSAPPVGGELTHVRRSRRRADMPQGARHLERTGGCRVAAAPGMAYTRPDSPAGRNQSAILPLTPALPQPASS